MASQPPPSEFQNPDYLPPIADDVLPPDLRLRLTKELATFDRARSRFVLCAGRYVLLRAMNRPFFNQMNGSPTRQPFITVHGTLATSVIIGLVSFFDNAGKDDINLLTIKNSLLRDKAKLNLTAIRDCHKARGIPESDTERLIERLDKTCRRVGKGRFKQLEVWRHREYAHIDLSPVRDIAKPNLYDIAICFVITAKIFRYIYCLLVPGRPDALMTLIRGNLRREAQRFVDSVRPLPRPPPRPWFRIDVNPVAPA
jgi:hypothetical protein